MTTLHLTLHRQWFDQIAAGIKKEEYREIKPYWTKRLAKPYEVIQFRNGYRSSAPVMLVEYHGYCIKTIVHPISGKKEAVYALRLGRILELKNYEREQVHAKAGQKDLSTH